MEKYTYNVRVHYTPRTTKMWPKPKNIEKDFGADADAAFCFAKKYIKKIGLPAIAKIDNRFWLSSTWNASVQVNRLPLV